MQRFHCNGTSALNWHIYDIYELATSDSNFSRLWNNFTEQIEDCRVGDIRHIEYRLINAHGGEMAQVVNGG